MQVFVFLAAEYETSKNSLNQVDITALAAIAVCVNIVVEPTLWFACQFLICQQIYNVNVLRGVYGHSRY